MCFICLIELPQNFESKPANLKYKHASDNKWTTPVLGPLGLNFSSRK